MPIILPLGDWTTYMASLANLLSFTYDHNREEQHLRALHDTDDSEEWQLVPRRVKIASCHSISASDAEEYIEAVQRLFSRIIANQTPVKHKPFYRDAACNL
ncbi:hypothetical protein K432DRAFT_402070 [Lepidopterella palustris CBS 459.81]|uniref:Uncharacterized protein n=1 Tax=Lepidopterella palustris CBS 459.81 TaxID=1314670 RepID=A0A8E2JI22_9PEZI|nr:hypothetical protein K432DRAFT_402070 [Lepidopterella palustris CBS 459.81]